MSEEKPACTHYSEAHALQMAATASNAVLHMIPWEAHNPQSSISGLAWPSTNTLFHAQLLPWKRPAGWVWEPESHGHLTGKQVSFITTTPLIHTADRNLRLENKRHPLYQSAITLWFSSSSHDFTPLYIVYSTQFGIPRSARTQTIHSAGSSGIWTALISVTFTVMLNFTGL